jgi:hypothetical protein
VVAVGFPDGGRENLSRALPTSATVRPRRPSSSTIQKSRPVIGNGGVGDRHLPDPALERAGVRVPGQAEIGTELGDGRREPVAPAQDVDALGLGGEGRTRASSSRARAHPPPRGPPRSRARVRRASRGCRAPRTSASRAPRTRRRGSPPARPRPSS